MFPEDMTSTLSTTTLQSVPPTEADGDVVMSKDDDTDVLPLDFYPSLPAFMAPNPASTSARGLVLSGAVNGADGSKMPPPKEKEIWFAVKETIIDVFGDAGWALVGSSFNGRSASVSPRQNLKTLIAWLLPCS
jgi:hypothetical protein